MYPPETNFTVHEAVKFFCIPIMCRHVDWLQAYGTDTFLEPSRLRRLTAELPEPDSQQPLILFFIGAKRKDLFIRRTFRLGKLRRGIHEGVATLRSVAKTLHAQCPVFLAESSTGPLSSAKASVQSCHPIVKHRILKFDREVGLKAVLLARLLFLFADVVCIFADDFPDDDSLTSALGKWRAASSSSALTATTTRPRLVVVGGESRQWESSAFSSFEEAIGADAGAVFASIHHVRGDQFPAQSWTAELSELIQRELESARQYKVEQCTLLSAYHTASLFAMAAKHVGKYGSQLFRPICAARRKLTGDANLHRSHLQGFLNLLKDDPSDFGRRYVASTLIMDAYPPKMHGWSSLPF